MCLNVVQKKCTFILLLLILIIVCHKPKICIVIFTIYKHGICILGWGKSIDGNNFKTNSTIVSNKRNSIELAKI